MLFSDLVGPIGRQRQVAWSWSQTPLGPRRSPRMGGSPQCKYPRLRPGVSCFWGHCLSEPFEPAGVRGSGPSRASTADLKSLANASNSRCVNDSRISLAIRARWASRDSSTPATVCASCPRPPATSRRRSGQTRLPENERSVLRSQIRRSRARGCTRQESGRRRVRGAQACASRRR